MFDISKFLLKGKTAIITGGSRGIGQAIAIGFARAGARVVVTSRKISDLEATAAEIKAFGGEAYAVQAHLGKMEDVKMMVDTSMEKLGGRIDILVNNAAANPNTADVLDADERLWDTIMNLNLRGLFFTSQLVAKIMKKQGGGKIINVASQAGFRPQPGQGVYSISKAGVRMLTQVFAIELGHFNIQVNTIAPGPFDTKMFQSQWVNLTPEEARKHKEEMEKTLPMGRIGNPDEMVGAAIYFASDASSFTTGTEMWVDGGVLLTMHDPNKG